MLEVKKMNILKFELEMLFFGRKMNGTKQKRIMD